MASPFPGMDPYLEPFWRDVHARFIVYASAQLQKQLPSDLRARIEERVVVEAGENGDTGIYPDIRVIERGKGTTRRARANGGIAVAEPVVVAVGPEKATETFIEIIDVGSNKRVVTVIEVFSLSNKLPGPSQQQYLQKQKQLLSGHVSLVEIDLLRRGERVVAAPVWRAPRSHRTLYQVCVRRGWRLQFAEIYAVPLEYPLPVIGVPLRKTDQDVPLDLQAILSQCYQDGGYDDDIDYAADPVPPLDRTATKWTHKLLRRSRKPK